LYYLCYAKKQLFKNSLIGSGKWANPSLYIELPENPSDGEIDAAKTFAYEIQNSSAGVLPAPLKAQLLEIANRSQNPNLEIMSFINDEIAKCINLSSAGTTSNAGASSYASKQIELTSSLIDENYMIGLSEDIINEKLIKLLCAVNYNIKDYPEELYPGFTFNPILSEEKSGLIDRLDKLNSMGFLDATSENDREFVRNIDGLPKESELINEPDFIQDTRSIRPSNVLLSDDDSGQNDLLMDQNQALNYSDYTDG
jgi:phage gp29-like protein